MSPKEELLHNIKEALNNQTITEEDLSRLMTSKPSSPRLVASNELPASSNENKKKLSIIDILFYLAGLVFYSALMVTAFQYNSGASIASVLVMLGTGLLIWTATYILGKQPNPSEVKKGLVNSLMLTGSLAVISGAIMAANQAVGSDSQGSAMAYAVSVALVVLGAAHLAFDKLYRHIILITFGVLLLTAAFPAVLIALLSNANPPPDVWTLIGITTGVILGYGGRLAGRTVNGRSYLKDSFESVSAFIILGSIYASIFSSSVAVIWEILLPLTIYLAFFISIKRRSKQFLITGSLFLIVFLITISFKYFSGLGVAFCLVLSALSLLATAFMSIRINNKYIKQIQPSQTG